LTDDDKDNEHVKLVANWLNTIATAILTAGAFVPAAQYIFGFLPETTDSGLVYGVAIVCVMGAVALHLIGQAALGLLK
jgi:hypothetical protein